MMNDTELILALIEELDTVEGRTMMQKIVFILRSEFNKFRGFRFSLHYYGPFSRDLADELDNLRLSGLLEEVPMRWGDTVRYDIRLTEAGKRKLRRIRQVPPRNFELMVRIARRLNAKPLPQVIDKAYGIAKSQGLH